MRIVIDDNSGFCFGVVRAIGEAEAALGRLGEVCSLGDIVHNRVEVQRLEALGLRTITHDEIESVGGGMLLIRAHGEPPRTYKLAEEFSKNKGKLPWPADGPVVGRFGKQFHPVFKNLELPPNNGLDIATAKSADVKTVFKGVVIQVFVMPGYNQCVLVQHGNYFTLYCKMKNIAVKAGDKVKTGQTLGVVDTINGQTQLHFQVWQGTKPQNPESWLK